MIQQPSSIIPPTTEKPAKEYNNNAFTNDSGFGVGVLTAEELFHSGRNPVPALSLCCSMCGSSQAKKVILS
ncbi:hypothetical protein NCCP2222_12870 [Sporosarcina sp. NCCP-2222]|uniref:hypothetical protein n=1 Tax=Sporosarcina sp. NCCP-2222 TaxID=2935073 RepID=UPI002083319D|nr:hypothetical protein [Sporosarcina sp. NCCP-2222]GKV55340.1 hypothetical protein NCCP2222_12870 [Sporosarcina sp. NCCP-2222]